MNLILLGPPGSGKGTQSHFLKATLKIPSVSTGDLLRQASRQKTGLGVQAEKFINKGRLVPDDIIIDIIKERLAKKDCEKGYILDGFPRTVAQAKALDEMLLEKSEKLDAVVNFSVEDDELIRRLSGRRICKECGATFNMEYSPPAEKGICDHCGGELYQRSDDKKQTIQERLKVYKQLTAPVIDYYGKEGVLKNVSGIGQTREVYTQLMKALNLLEVT